MTPRGIALRLAGRLAVRLAVRLAAALAIAADLAAALADDLAWRRDVFGPKQNATLFCNIFLSLFKFVYG